MLYLSVLIAQNVLAAVDDFRGCEEMTLSSCLQNVLLLILATGSVILGREKLGGPVSFAEKLSKSTFCYRI